MAGESSTVSDQVLQWYSKLFSRRVDLVGDFAGSERFLIHGEALLRHCFSDAQIDFEPGLQLLHASYAVEKFLHGLVSRRCNFHIAFFDEYQDLCVPQDASSSVSEKYLLARAAIIRHLQVNLGPVHPDIEIKVFPSTTSEAFEEYLSTTDVYFVLCHDGASTKDVRRKGLLQKNTDSPKGGDKSLQERHEQHKLSLRTFIYGMMQRGYSAALVNGLEFQDTKAIASVLEHSRAMTLKLPKTTSSSSTSNTSEDTAALKESLSTIKSSNEHAFTEREYLAVLVAAKFASKSKDHQDFAVALLSHTAFLSELSLPDRLMQYEEPSQESLTLTLEFCQEARIVLAQTAWVEEAGKLAAACDVADLIDGRLFASCLQSSSTSTSDLFQYLARAASMLCGQEELKKTGGASTSTTKSNGDLEKADDGTSYRLLPFANEIFDKHLAPVHLKVAKSDGKVDSTSAVIFREVTNWRNTKPVQSKSGPVVKDEKAAKKALRRNQFFMAEMTTYAASLTNAVGRALEPETIHIGGASKPSTPVPSRPATPSQDPADKKGKKAGGKPGGKNKNQAKQDMLANIAASSKRKDEDTAEKQTKAWVVFCDGLEKQADLPSRYEKAKKYLVNLNTDIKRKALEAEVRLYMLNVLLKMWIEHCRKDDKEEGLYTAALIFDAVRASCGLSSVTKTIAACLKTTIDRLKLPSLQVPSIEGDRKLAFPFVLDETSSADLALSLSPEEFQLLYCGPYFDRTMDSAPDPRVPFEPDAWQRKVLDEIDARRSLLVVAPTSAGKTFISFYAMKQVLESNNEDVLVYVAPTKALVNQIAAEVQARFSKNYKYANSVWGIHTRDTRVNNPTGCQILVTVPHILQIMLLAPTNARGWSERVKWIIFDEVHCIGQAEDGLIWEQLLLMAPCPIIALSATVGNAEAFSDWLSSTQKAAGNDLTMVQHKHRYSDLRKFLYVPPKDAAKRVAAALPLSTNRTFARLGLDDVPNFTFMHPVASLTNRRRGMPSDFSLEARDCYFLWQSMSKHQTPEYPVDKSLTPSAVLPKVMRKADIISWESGLKNLLAQWMADEKSPFEAVRKDFSTSVTKSALQINDSTAEPVKENLEVDDPASNHDVDNILPLLTELHQQDALPGIIFNYDRAVCERMCRTVLTQLEEAETEWKKTSPKWAEKLREWEEYKKEVARRAKQGVRAAKGTTKEEQMMEAANREVSPFATFNPDRPLEGFHFADSKKLSSEEILSHEKELRYRGVDEVFIQGLQRGIGVHHAGMNRKYRYAVEVLFRRGYLKVVIATGTLALGINMPCKTVVFSGDSIFLTALNYRQAAGRAGRRGFDSLGNVVFHGVSLSKINKLISSRLPDLNGHFPITTTLVLRLFALLHDSENSPFALRCINALLSQPRVYLGGEESKMTVLHHLRFSIEYLRRQSLLDSAGAPLNFAGAVSHLYFTENSSFAFHALLKNGYFHELCDKVNTSQELVLRELMLTMSHLFGRLQCRQADEEFVQEVVKGSPSVVFLPNMPENAVNVLRKHNDQTLDIFTSYVRTFVEQHIQEPDNTLPLTSTVVGGSSNKSPAPHKVRSSFVALSGHNDSFASIHELCTTSRSGVFLEEAVVPYVGIYPEDSDLPLNAYLYDFFMHGNADAVVTTNRIRRGDIWFVLNDFSMVLATIVTSLTNFMNLGTESDLDFIDVRGGGDDDEEDLEDKLQGVADDQQGPATGTQGARGPAAQQNLPVQLAKKKKKVVDSWDEEAESSSEGENWDDGEESEEEAEVAWDEKTGLLNVLKAFKLLKADFDTKFRAMWA